MGLGRRLASAFGLDDRGWSRHASPWSVWTRVATLPLLVAAIWSRAWLGGWALAPVAVVLGWTWVNPRLFPPPRSTENWASKAVLGERVWLNRAAVPIPDRHRVVPHLLVGLSLVGTLMLVAGLVALEPWPTLMGTALAFLGKLWFVDRMVWLYEDMREATPEYRSWAR